MNYSGETLKQRQTHNQLLNVCREITLNYDKLLGECISISNLLNIAREYATSSYSRKEFILGWTYSSYVEYETPTLLNIACLLDDIDCNASNEFFSNIDFLHIKNAISEKNNKIEIATFIWEATKAFDNILFQINRIKSEEDYSRKIAILKGMIVYC